jgi:peptidoglycan/xylan/chitin deacetylase (PgdA/CDA1 family)
MATTTAPRAKHAKPGALSAARRPAFFGPRLVLALLALLALVGVMLFNGYLRSELGDDDRVRENAPSERVPDRVLNGGSVLAFPNGKPRPRPVPRKTVALTFDDGPDPVSTPAILDLLAERHVTATFCMVGQQALAHPDLVRRVVAEGHRLCNHTFTHDAGIALRPPEIIDEQLRASRDALVRVAGPDVPIPYFRAPEGVWSAPLERTAAQEGMRPLGWSVDTLDWTRPGTDAIVTSVKQGLHPGAVVLFHDGGGPRDQTVAAVRQLLPWLAEQKYSSVLPV